MKVNDFLLWLDSFLNFEKKQVKGIFWLDSMKFLCELLGNPQNRLKCIHVAGSKGKGSVCSMIANIIENNGFSCGVYASPHIVDFRERIGRPGSFFDESVYEKAADRVFNAVSKKTSEDFPEGRSLTWFEIVTAYAFVCFEIAKVDYVVLETGLGGRLDSTNVVMPILSVITPIELEHTEFLGNTIKQIAEEKAGIIKNGIPCVVAMQRHKEAKLVFAKKANNFNSECIFVDDTVSSEKYDFVIEEKNMFCRMKISFFFDDGEKKTFFEFYSKLLGHVQAENAATAVTAIKVLFPDIKKDVIEKGLSDAKMSGRFEVCKGNWKNEKVTVVFDGAHTKDSVFGTLDTFEKLFINKKVYLLFACASDKKYSDFIPLFKSKLHFEKVAVTKPGYVRQSNIDGVCECFFKNGIPFLKEEDCSKALFYLLQDAAKNDGIILITGSFYLVSEAKQSFKNFGIIFDEN